MNALNNFFFIGLPYLAIALFVVGCLYRYRATGFKFSSLSSQFISSDKLFLGSNLFHWSVLIIFSAHLFALLFPGLVLSLNSNASRLVIQEIIGFIFGLGMVVGLSWLFIRRISSERVRVVTSRMDVFIELLIIAQAVIGCSIAYSYRWGSSWFASELTPYLWSILTFEPRTTAVTEMPTVVMIHIVVAFAILAIFPFTRLVHILVAPFSYIWRPYQKVMWNWNPKLIRSSDTAWSDARPRNN